MKKVFFSDVIMLLTSIFVCFSFFSCDKGVIMEGASNDITHFVSSAEAEKNVMDFLSNIEPSTRGVLQNRRIESVVSVVSQTKTRSSIKQSDNKPLYYVVNFADNKGFALASSDDREPQIYAFVEKGKYSSSNGNEGYNAFISNLKSRCTYLNETGNYSETNNNSITRTGSDGSTIIDKMPPLLVTKWGQGAPYNYAVRHATDYKETGCVPTALAQICSYLEKPQTIDNCIPYADVLCLQKDDKIRLDWEAIKEESENYNINDGFTEYSENIEYQIATLMWYLGKLSGAKKTQDSVYGTEADPYIAIWNLQNLGINATDIEKYNVDKVINALKENKIIFMCGGDKNNPSDGHAWVVDGYIITQHNNTTSKYIHCNWGCDGEKNGYYLNNVLNLNEGPTYKEESDRNNTYFQHVLNQYYINNLKMSIITPKQNTPTPKKGYFGIALFPYPHMQDNYEVWDCLECADGKTYYHEEYVGNYGVRYTSETYTTKKGGTYTLDELLWDNKTHILSATVTGCSKNSRMYYDKISFKVSLVVDDKVVGPAEMDNYGWYCPFKITGTPRGGKETDFGEFNVYDEIELPIGNYTIQLESYQVQEDLDNTPLKIYYPLP